MKNPNPKPMSMPAEMPMPPEAEIPMEPPMPSGMASEGEVSMSIPKADFDALFDLIQQLYGMLEGMKSTVDTQQMAAESEIGATAGTMPSATDVADLEMFAKELSARGA